MENKASVKSSGNPCKVRKLQGRIKELGELSSYEFYTIGLPKVFVESLRWTHRSPITVTYDLKNKRLVLKKGKIKR